MDDELRGTLAGMDEAVICMRMEAKMSGDPGFLIEVDALDRYWRRVLDALDALDCFDADGRDA